MIGMWFALMEAVRRPCSGGLQHRALRACHAQPSWAAWKARRSWLGFLAMFDGADALNLIFVDGGCDEAMRERFRHGGDGEHDHTIDRGSVNLPAPSEDRLVGRSYHRQLTLWFDHGRRIDADATGTDAQQNVAHFVRDLDLARHIVDYVLNAVVADAI